MEMVVSIFVSKCVDMTVNTNITLLGNQRDDRGTK